MLGVLAGGVLTRRTQERHWLKDTKAEVYTAVLREYTRIEFDLRMANVERRAPKVDWAPWGAALAALSLVAEDQVVAGAERLAQTFVRMEALLHNAQPQQEEWLRLQRVLIDEQMAFVNLARQSLDRAQPQLTVRVGGPPAPAA